MKKIFWYLLCPIPVISYYILLLAYYNFLEQFFLRFEWLRPAFLASSNHLYSFAVCTGSVAAFTAAVCFYRHMRKNEDAFPSFRFTRSTVFVLLVLAFSSQYLIDLILEGISAFFPRTMDGYMEVLEELGVIKPTVMDLIYSIILAPFLEEALVRGATLSIARKAVPFWAANLIQALIFGIMHMNIVQSSYAFVMGLMLGGLVYRYHSLAPAFFVHLLINLSGMLLVPGSPGALLFCLAASLLLLTAALLYQKKQDPEQALFTKPVPL